MFGVTLHRVGHVSEEAFVYTIEEVSATVVAFQRKWNMGARDMGDFHGEVRVQGILVYIVTYNGRVWRLGPNGAAREVAFDPNRK